MRRLLDAADPGRTRLTHFAVKTASLDDVFLTLTQPGQTQPGQSQPGQTQPDNAKEISHV